MLTLVLSLLLLAGCWWVTGTPNYFGARRRGWARSSLRALSTPTRRPGELSPARPAVGTDKKGPALRHQPEPRPGPTEALMDHMMTHAATELERAA